LKCQALTSRCEEKPTVAIIGSTVTKEENDHGLRQKRDCIGGLRSTRMPDVGHGQKMLFPKVMGGYGLGIFIGWPIGCLGLSTMGKFPQG